MNLYNTARKIFLASAAISCPMVVSASELYVQEGWYAGLRAGYSNNENSCQEEPISCDQTEFGYGGFAGYDINKNVGVELSYNDIGDTKARYPTVSLDGKLREVDLAVRLSHVLNDHLKIYGKVGAAYWDSEITGGPYTLEEKDLSPLFGAGFEVPVSRRLAARLEYQYIHKVGNDVMGFTNPHYVGLALVWHFSAPEPEPLPVVAKEPEPVPVAVPVEQRITVDEQLGGPLFDYDKAEIRNTAAIDPVVKILRDNPLLDASITGHTDSRGSAEYNQRLSERRAAVVANYLTTKGIDQGRIKTFGMGENVPVADNDTDAGRARNRRVEFVITGTKTNP
jgi:OmpA-OmpF porin, OOP family